jgi:hypothetical protein
LKAVINQDFVIKSFIEQIPLTREIRFITQAEYGENIRKTSSRIENISLNLYDFIILFQELQKVKEEFVS